MEKHEITHEYIQFSKRVTKWGMILVSSMLFICIAIITFMRLTIEEVEVISRLYTTYVTIMGVTIGAYQGNSSLEKWTKAKYNFEQALNTSEENKTEDEEDDEDYSQG